IPDYSISVPNFAANNKIIFGYQGDGQDIKINTLTALPDSVSTKISKEPEKDTLNFWITPFTADSLIFTVSNEREKIMDTFSVKTRKVAADTLILRPNQRGGLEFGRPFYIGANTPISKIDSTKINLWRNDSTEVKYTLSLD